MRAQRTLLAAILAGTALTAPAADPQLNPLALTDPGSLAAALPTLAAALPSILSEAAPIEVVLLSEAIADYAPTNRLSDLPGILSTAVPILESAADAALTAYGAAYLPPSVVAELPSLIATVAPQLESDIDAYASHFPGSISLAVIPSVLSTALPAINSEIAAEISADVPIISSYLTAYAGALSSYEAAALGTGTGGLVPLPTGGLNGTASTLGASGQVPPSATALSTLPAFTGAASRGEAWAGGVVGVVGAIMALGTL